jgi:O-antigen/teichoic acid export membrane protein
LRGINRAQAQPTVQQEVEKSGADLIEWTPREVARRAIHSVLALGVRQIVAQGLNILGAIFLARLLTPAEFGIYAIIVFIRGFLTAFSDAGLAASLIRQPVEPDEGDYRAIFTFQQMMVLGVAVPFWLACPLIAHLYKLPVHDAWVFRLVDLSLLCSSFQVIPSTKLERDLAFHKIAVIEISMAVVFNGVSVFLAYQGWGEMSFAWGLFLRSIIGAGLANAIRPWRIGWRWDWERIREHMRFGIPYQGIAFISLMKDSIGPTLIAIFLGAAEMGYVNWAIMITYYPLLVLAVLQRVYLPAFARLQRNPESLSRAVEKVLLATNGIVAPAALATLVFIRPITSFIFGEKWLVAVPLFYVFWAGNLFTATSAPLQSLLNALGFSKTTFLFAVTWAVGTWVIGAPLILLIGAMGYAVATLGINFTNLLLFRIAQSRVRFKLISVVGPVWGVAGLLALAVLLVRSVLPLGSSGGLAACIALYAGSYMLVCGSLYRTEIRRIWSLFWRSQWEPASLR